MTLQELQAVYLSYLAREGFTARLNEDGDIVVVKVDGRTFLVFLDEEDPEFFLLAYPRFYKVESDLDRQNALAACERVAATVRVSKAFLRNGYAWASYEARYTPLTGFEPIFPRALRSLRAAAAVFMDHLEASPTPGPVARA